MNAPSARSPEPVPLPTIIVGVRVVLVALFGLGLNWLGTGIYLIVQARFFPKALAERFEEVPGSDWASWSKLVCAVLICAGTGIMMRRSDRVALWLRRNGVS